VGGSHDTFLISDLGHCQDGGPSTPTKTLDLSAQDVEPREPCGLWVSVTDSDLEFIGWDVRWITLAEQFNSNHVRRT